MRQSFTQLSRDTARFLRRRWKTVSAAVVIALGSGGLALRQCVPWLRLDLSDRGLTRSSLTDPDGRTVSYLAAGDPAGQRVLFIHGSPGKATGYAHLLRDGPAGTERVSVDRLGFGQSDPTPETSLAAQAAAIEPLLVIRDTADGPRGTIIVGHSYGGPIAAWLAAEHPDRVAAIVIVGGSLDPELEELKWYNDAVEWPVVRGIAGADALNSNAEMRDAKSQTELLRPKLTRITCPIILIHGEGDPLVPIENADYMQREMTAAARIEINCIPGGGHFLPWSRPELVQTAVERLVTGEASNADAHR